MKLILVCRIITHYSGSTASAVRWIQQGAWRLVRFSGWEIYPFVWFAGQAFREPKTTGVVGFMYDQ